MIASILGKLESRGPDHVVVSVGGLGILVFVPTSTQAALGDLGEDVRLHTHLYFKEDTIALYGFAAPEELRLFRLLLNVGGMGPKTSLNALSALTPSQFVTAVVSEDLTMLTRIPGVGKKTAARITLELKGVLEKEWTGMASEPGVTINGDAMAALMSLGYAQSEARSALVAVTGVATLPLDEQVRQALQRLGQ